MKSRGPEQLQWLCENLPKLTTKRSVLIDKITGEKQRLEHNQKENRYHLTFFTGYGYNETLTGIREITPERVGELDKVGYWEGHPVGYFFR